MNSRRHPHHATDLAHAIISHTNGIKITQTVNRVAFGKIDLAIARAFKAQPIEGVYDVICHGTYSGMTAAPIHHKGIYALQHTYWSAQTLAEYLETLPDYHGQPVRLVMCYVGKNHDGFAAQLAGQLHTTVYAVTGALEPLDDGQLIPNTPGDYWHEFAG